MNKGIIQLALVALPLCAYADVVPAKIPLTGVVKSVAIDAATKQLEFYAISSGNISASVGVELDGPGGTKAVVEAKILKGDEKKALVSKAGWFAVGLSKIASKAATTSTSSSSTSSVVPTGATGACSGVSSAALAKLQQLYASYGMSSDVAMQTICTLLGGAQKAEQDLGSSYQSTTSLNLGQAGSIGFLQKNACAPKNVKTLVRVRVDLSKVPADQIAANTTVGVALREYDYKGSRAASLKPTSDGKYAPQPLILMSSIGSVGNGESVRVVNWKSNKPTKPLTIKVSDYVYYRGMVLSRIVASKALSGGGQATFELTNGQSIYGICLKRARSRQRVNGYPG